MKLEEKIQKMEKRRNELYDKSPRTPAEDKEKERVTNALVEALRQQAKSLYDELSQIGIWIKSVWDLVNTSASYPEAVPILVKYLSEPYHLRNKEGIVRSLAVKEAKGVANKAIMDEYLRTPKEGPDQPGIYYYRWVFGNTMSVIVTKDDLDEMIEIVLDESNGDSRDSFVDALGKLKSPKVIDVLNQLVNDESSLVSQAAQKALNKKAMAKERKARSH